MALFARGAYALGWSVSVVALSIAYTATASAQQNGQQTASSAGASAKQNPVQQRAAKRGSVRQAVASQAAQSPLDANAQAGSANRQQLDEITTTASKTEERAVDALAPVSVVTLEQIQGRQATRIGDLIYNIPGVWTQDRGDDPSTSINIRGLQDFGRVAYIVDGARQNYQRTGHFANGSFYLNPEFIAGIDIVRGPTANIYGSGAIGGVASFRTKDFQDVVRPGERWGVDANTIVGTNRNRALGSIFGGVQLSPNVDLFAGATYSTQDDYRDGTGFGVTNTGNKLSGAIGKLTFRPADGHEVKLGHVFQENVFNVGQFPRLPGAPNTTGTTVNGGTSIYHSNVRNYTTTLGWKYSRPDDNIWDLDTKVYWNRTDNDQIKTAHTSAAITAPCTTPGNPISGCIGSVRGYELNTLGFDVFNTSRVDVNEWRHAFTYGVDGFQDNVASTDATGTQDATTPGGKRAVFGSFVQWKMNYSSLLEVISAVRYDNYELTSPAGGAKGDRFSPKITVGLLPASVVTPYVSYAEGYRAPSITETLVSGSHAAGSIGSGFFVCPAGVNIGGVPGPPNNALFCFLPNPNLKPEVGKNKEIGINVKKNDLFAAGDSFRGKFNVFRNDVTDYIDAVTFGTPFFGQRPFYQYQNISAARIEGVEAETMYDANLWFVGVSGSVLRGTNQLTGVGLYSIPGHKITTNAGVRFLDGRVALSAMWTHIAMNDRIPAGYLPATTYEMVNVYLTAKPTEDVTLNFSVENLLNQYYRPYAVPTGSDTTSTQNDVKWASAGAGIVFKAGAKVHFGGS